MTDAEYKRRHVVASGGLTEAKAELLEAEWYSDDEWI